MTNSETGFVQWLPEWLSIASCEAEDKIVTTPSHDRTRPPDLANEHVTGPLRQQRPIYRNLMPPCNHACPAGEDIQGWLALAQAGRYRDAWVALTQNNPFPAVSGRICYHGCETACNRGDLDEAVSIHAVERFLGDKALEEGWMFPVPPTASGKRVVVIGAGPCGLAATYHLRRLGHAVTLCDAGTTLGGMMHAGIPKYRLPRNVLDSEIDRIIALGVEVRLNCRVDDIEALKKAGNYDAVLLAIGASLSNRVEIPGCDAQTIVNALDYLRSSENSDVKLGRRVAVYGGGNTAMDAARTARRMGAHETMIIYRGDRERMAAHDFEVEEALNEDIKIHWLRRIEGMEKGDLKVEIMKRNADGQLVGTGKFESLGADTLVMAIGQNVDVDFLRAVPGITLDKNNSIEVDPHFMTMKKGIFAGGDMISDQRTATHAFGHGKRAARSIHAWLYHQAYQPHPPKPVVTRDQLHLVYHTVSPQKKQPSERPEERIVDFREITQGLTEPEAVFEAKRCFACGNCFECDGCMAACPQRAIEKLGVAKGYEINYDLCTGCGVCVEQCPSNAMTLIPEEGASEPRVRCTIK